MRENKRPKSHGVTWKSIAITLVLIPFNFYWIIAGEVGLVGYALNTYAVPFYNVVFVVFAFTLLNLATRRRLFTDAELLTIYILLSTACAFPSITLMTILVTTVGHAFYFATPENEWKQLFYDYLPRWLLVDDPKALTGYYTGESSLSTVEIISIWIVPILSWAAFMTVLVLVMFVYQRYLAEAVGGTRAARLSDHADSVSRHPQHEIAVFAPHHMARIWNCGIYSDSQRLEFSVSDAAYLTQLSGLGAGAGLDTCSQKSRGMLSVVSVCPIIPSSSDLGC